MAPRSPRGMPPETQDQRDGVKRALATTDKNERVVAAAQYGVYAFFDFDGEPIYVGQTREQLRVRIGRHLTGQRSDAVAKYVLDPFEVAEIEMWPLWELAGKTATDPDVKKHVNGLEHAVYKHVLEDSKFEAVLNEGDMPNDATTPLPESLRVSVVQPDTALYTQRSHPDVRIARRANTIASLARNIAERQVSSGLRRTLLTQALRLEWLAQQRYIETTRDELPPTEPNKGN